MESESESDRTTTLKLWVSDCYCFYVEEKKMSDDIKTCKLCSEEVKKSEIETFPLFYNNGTYEPKSNIVFCSKRCVKRFLIMPQRKAYLLSLYSSYCLIKFGIVALEPSPDPDFLACRQIKPTPQSLTLNQFHNRAISQSMLDPKQCALCFYQYTGYGNTYVTHKIHDIFQFANMGFCGRACVNRFIGSLDPNYRELFDEYRGVIHNDQSGSFSHDPEDLVYHQIIRQSNALTFLEFKEQVMLPKPIHTEHYYSSEILRKNVTKQPTKLATFAEEEEEKQQL
jgi:hypothetical protein